MEAAELGLLMFCICLFGTTLYSKASPVNHLELSSTEKALLMGIAVATHRIAACLLRKGFP